MKRQEITSPQNNCIRFEKEISELLSDQILFTESVFARVPMGIEIYDAQGILRDLNTRAEQTYGIKRSDVINKINLFDSPYVDKDLKAKIQSGEEVILEFEYDFERINREYYATPNKNTIIYEAQVVPILNKNGEQKEPGDGHESRQYVILGVRCTQTGI